MVQCHGEQQPLFCFFTAQNTKKKITFSLFQNNLHQLHLQQNHAFSLHRHPWYASISFAYDRTHIASSVAMHFLKIYYDHGQRWCKPKVTSSHIPLLQAIWLTHTDQVLSISLPSRTIASNNCPATLWKVVFKTAWAQIQWNNVFSVPGFVKTAKHISWVNTIPD